MQATDGQEDKYREQWGLEWAGQAFNSRISGSGPNNRANGAGYWSTDQAANASFGIGLHVVDNDERGGTIHPQMNPSGSMLKQYGFLVRCLQDKQ
jgi:hypothetical protein